MYVTVLARLGFINPLKIDCYAFGLVFVTVSALYKVKSICDFRVCAMPWRNANLLTPAVGQSGLITAHFGKCKVFDAYCI